jgi:hypothetical protein
MENKYAIVLDSVTAIKRIQESKLTNDDRDYYLKFINNFRNLTFYFNTELSMSEPATSDDIFFPQTFIDYRKILADVLYGSEVEVKFGSFIKYSPRSKRLNETWYVLDPGRFTYNDDQRQVLLENGDIKLLPIGFNLLKRDKNCYLALNLDEKDKSVYEFNMQDLYDNFSSNEPVREMTSEVFDSYPQMLASISEIKYINGKKEIIVKAGES